MAHCDEEEDGVISEGTSPADELAGAVARVSGLLLTDQTVATALETITSLAMDTIGGSTGSGVSLLSVDGRRVTSAATDRLVEQLDDLQYGLDEGPCLTAWRDQSIVRTGALDVEQRWPAWSPRAAELGIRSVLSAPMIVGDRVMGAMKVYSTAADAYGERDEDVLRRFGIQAAIFVGNVQTAQVAERLSDQLKETLRTRDLIAMARGIVMARRGVGPEDAAKELMAESHRTGQPIREVAQRMVASPMDT
jgi:GAF domain-containing protein